MDEEFEVYEFKNWVVSVRKHNNYYYAQATDGSNHLLTSELKHPSHVKIKIEDKIRKQK